MKDISVIIPAYNAQKTLPLLLRALSEQEASCTFEVIVVDNESNDRTLTVISDAFNSYTMDMKSVSQPRGVNIASVRNFGVKNASGRILAFIDSDCEPSRDWLQQGYNRLENNPNLILLAGSCKPPPGGTWVERAWHSTRSGHKNGSFFVHGANFFIPKVLFDKIGGFREDLETSEDYDLGRRVSLFHEIVYSDDITVIHYGEANTLKKKFAKERWYSKNLPDLLKCNLLYKPFWISLFMILCLVFLTVSIISLKWNWIFLAALLILSTSSFLSFYFCRRAKCYDYFWPMVPICFVYLAGRGLGIIDVAFASMSAWAYRLKLRYFPLP